MEVAGYKWGVWDGASRPSFRRQETILDMVNNASIMGLFRRSAGPEKRCCVIMDEVDGCDRSLPTPPGGGGGGLIPGPRPEASLERQPPDVARSAPPPDVARLAPPGPNVA